METTAILTGARRRRTLKIASWVLATLVALCGGLASIALAAGPPSGTLDFTWKIGDRYGLDRNVDGIVDNPDGISDLAGDKAWIQNPTYRLSFDTCASPAVTEREGLITEIALTLTGPAPATTTKTVKGTSCSLVAEVAKLGSYEAKIDIKVGPMTVDTATKTIVPKDLLLVSVGDSVASGEGNPDRLAPGLPTFDPQWQNEQCHRTGLAGPAQAALRLERRDPHSAITFVHLACSGASITEGLLGSYDGIEKGPNDKVLAPQLDQLRDLVGSRPVDALTVSIGANDAKFSAVVKACLALTNCSTDSVPGQKSGKELFDQNSPGIEANYPLLDARLDRMAQQTAGDVRLAGPVFFTQYMDVTKDDRGQICTGQTPKEIADRVDTPWGNTDGLTATEMAWASTYVQDALNTRVKAQIDKANATNPTTGAKLMWIDGINTKFGTHGYCAQDRWIRTLAESGLYQRGVDGAFHPNAEGHLYGYATSIEPKLATALGVGGTALPLEPDAATEAVGDALSSWIGTLDKVGGLDALTNALPLGARHEVQAFIREKLFIKLLPWLQDRLEEGRDSITQISEWLDDPDRNGNPGVDVPGWGGVTLDLSGDISPRLPASAYDITLRLKGTVELDPDLALRAGELGVDGEKLKGDVAFDQTVKLHVDLTKGPSSPERVTLPVDDLSGDIDLDLAADFGATDPAVGPDRPALTFQAGVLELVGKGTASADLHLGYDVADPNGDGKIDATELGDPLTWIRARCESGGAHVDLKASSRLVGFTNTIGRIQLDDANVCDGVEPPTVDLSELGQFEGVTTADFVNGLAQLTRALEGIQTSSDIDIPFVQEGISGVVKANQKLVKFFVDNGLTDPEDPLSRITFDPEDPAFDAIDTIDEILPKLAAALGVDVTALHPRVVDQRLLLDLASVFDPPAAQTGSLDFGDQLDKTGLTEVAGSAKATIDPSVRLDLALGVDLRKDVEFGQRFFFQTAAGTAPELVVDGKVTADLDLDARLSLLEVELKDDTAGPVTLLERKDPAKPVLTVDLNAGPDGRLTLDEITTPVGGKANPFTVALNAKVPAFTVTATAKLADTAVAQGKVGISWPDLTVPSGLAITADASFTNQLIPFAYDPNNPRATITNLLTATHSGVAKLREVLSSDDELIKALPLAGRSASDLDPVLADIEAALAELIELDQQLTLPELERRLERAIGEALDIPQPKWVNVLDFAYTPQVATGSVGAALTARLDLGICSADRAAAAGCSHVVDIGDVPLNLQLGKTADSLAAVTTAGKVDISYDGRLKLGAGIELPYRTTPVPTDAEALVPRAFVLDSSSFELGVGAKVRGSFTAVLGPIEVGLGKTGDEVKADAAARYVLRDRTANPDQVKRIYVGSELNSWIGRIDPDPTTNGGLHDLTYPADCPPDPKADACGKLPVYIEGAFAGNATFRMGNLLDTNTWTFDAQQVIDNLGDESFQLSLLIGGIEAFTQRLEASIRNLPQGKTIPILGIDPTKGADALEDFRTGVLVPAQELVNKINAANNAAAVRNAIQTFMFEKVGPAPSLGLLQDRTTDADQIVTKEDVTVLLKCPPPTGSVPVDCNGTEPIRSLQDLQIRMTLGKAAEVHSEPFSAGFPGLRLSSPSEDGFEAGIGFKLDLAFGIDRTNGFYVPTDAVTGPELRVEATASLPDQLDAELAFIPVKLTDISPAGPEVIASIGVDLSAGGLDNKLTVTQLSSVRIEPSVSACANVKLGLVTGANTKFPQFKADLTMSGGFKCAAGGGTGAPATDAGFGIAFDNVRVNAGSLLNDLIGPAAKAVRRYTSPLEGTVDALDEPIPGIAEAARAIGRPAPTWWQLMEAINSIKMAAGEDDQLVFIRRLRTLIQLTRTLDGAGNSYSDIALGDFDISTTVASRPGSATAIDELLTGENPVKGTTSLIERLNGDGGVPVKFSDPLQKQAPYQSLTFPALDKPQRLFELLIGRDVPLVRFEAGGSFLHVPIGPYRFPVGPATVYFGGALDVRGHFAAGFDTYGIRKAFAALTDDDPTNNGFGAAASNILGGLYIDDYDADGNEIPELQAQAEITVGAGVGIPGFGVFAEGGVHADAQIDLKTGDDGKLRAEQLIAQLRKNPNPVCIFDASARIDAFVRVVVSNPIKDVEFPIADAVILDEPDLTEFCNTQQDDTDTKLTGRLYKDGTLEVFSTDESDRIQVSQQGPGTVSVTSMGVTETFEGVNRIFVDGKGGNDAISLTSTTADPRVITGYACGGTGRDTITVDIGASTQYGGTGPGITTVENDVPKPLPCSPVVGSDGGDTLTGGPLVDKLYGGDGGDALAGGPGSDELRGEGGQDTLMPGADKDLVVDGGAGDKDTISSVDRWDATPGITTDLATKRSGATGSAEGDVLNGIETAVGGPRDDILIAAPSGSVLDGGWGNDELRGGNGSDALIGSSGNDTILGGDSYDILAGADGDDRLVGNGGPDIYQGGLGTDTADWSAEPGPVNITLNGQPDDGRPSEPFKDNVLDVEIVLGGPGPDVLSAGATPAELRGGGGDDVLNGPGTLLGEGGDDDLRGSELRDILSGGPGKDRLLGKGGQDDLDGGADDDHLDGGTGPDLMVGGGGFDTVDYTSRTTKVTVEIDGQADDGEGNAGTHTGPDCGSTACDEVRPDNERILGGTAGDVFRGDEKAQTFVGNDGDDDLYGYGGADRFEAGNGDDWVRDYDQAVSRPDPVGVGDVVLLGPGNDHFQGSGGDETIVGDSGNDDATISGSGTVTVDLGSGDDDADLDDGNHTITGGPGDDDIHTDAGVKVIDSGEGDDWVTIGNDGRGADVDLGPGDDELSGGELADIVDGGPGKDSLNGDGGNDVLTDLVGQGSVNGGLGGDTIATGPGTDAVTGGDGNDTITDAGGDGGYRNGWAAQSLSGNGGDDTITLTGPSTLDDGIWGGDGKDTLTGHDGTQTIIGDSGNDTIDGRGGDDKVNGGNDDDTVRGGDGDDWVAGGDGVNILDGGRGGDRIEGGNGHDTVSYADRTTPVTVVQGDTPYGDGGSEDESTTVPGRRDNLAYTVEHIIGTERDDVIAITSIGTGETAPPRIEGRGGRDTLVTSEGALLEGGAGADTLLGGGEVDTLDGGLGNDLLAGGGGADVVRGGDGDDRLDEGSAVNGGDSLQGGPGTDVADYSARPAGSGVTVTPGTGGANDDAPGEGDNVDATVEQGRLPGTATATPTVTLTVDKTAVSVGQTVTVTVTVAGSAGTPTGAVDVFDRGGYAGAGVVDATGKATVAVRMDSVGTNRTLTATYRGDDRYRSASSTGTDINVSKVATTVSLAVLETPLPVGTKPRLRVTVTPAGSARPFTGRVTILEGTTNVGAIDFTNGTGTADISALPLGRHDLVASWAGDGNTSAATSAPVTVLVTADGIAPAPTVNVATDPATPTAGAPTTVRATLAPVPGTPVPTGTVTFTADDGDTATPPVALGTAPANTGVAQVAVPAGFPGGTWTLAAAYSGSELTKPGTGTKQVTVAKTATTTTVTSSTPTAKVSESVTLTAKVTRASGTAAPTGRVTFLSGADVLGSVSVDATGTAALMVALPAGTHTVTARYEGSSTLQGSTSLPITQTVTRADGTPATATTTTVALTGADLVATVTPTAATGSVRFTIDGDIRATVALAAGKATFALPALGAGPHTVVATYLGSATHATSTSDPLELGGTTKTPTTTVVARQGADLVATVTPTAATGMVRFSIDGTPVATVAVATGRASTPVPALAAGAHTVTATYLGSGTHAPSTSAPITIQGPAATTTTVARNGANLVATVTPTAATGQVRFTIDGTAGTPVALTSGTASTPLPTLAPGTHTVTATYLGSATHASSTSAPITITVAAGTPPSAPGAPTVTAATATGANLGWTAPTSAGSTPIAGYRITVRADAGGTVVASVEVGAGRTAPVTGLTPGRLYRFTVAARNASGYGPESALSAPALPPFRSLDAFTDRQYRDWAGRPPTAAELTSWRTRLAAGTVTPQALVDGLAGGSYAAPVAPITRLFNAYFLRLPDINGLNHWVTQSRKGMALKTISQSFASSPEFKARYGNLSNAAFVRLVYTNVLGRQPDAAGLKHWTGQLDKGATRGSVMVGFSESGEYKTKTKAVTDIVTVFRFMLLRVPTAAERATWEPRLKAGTPRAELIAWILTQPTYDARV